MWLETINVWLPLALIVLGFFAGRRIERRHYDDIHRREKAVVAVPIVTSKTLDDDRARREAVLRMRESATDADLFLNFRIQTATLHSGRAQAPGSVEVIAYATAMKFNAAWSTSRSISIKPKTPRAESLSRDARCHDYLGP